MNTSPQEIARICRADISTLQNAIAYCESIARSQTELSGDYAAAASILREQAKTEAP